MHCKLATSWMLAAAGLLPIAAGCSRTAAVSGSVSYEGQPVANGAITFLPEDGRGSACGGPIVDGHYRVDNVPPGNKIAQIMGVKTVPFARTSADMARAAKEAAQKGDTTGIIDRADVIPADAEGNNRVLELTPGEQTVDFRLIHPSGGHRK